MYTTHVVSGEISLINLQASIEPATDIHTISFLFHKSIKRLKNAVIKATNALGVNCNDL